MKRKRVLWLPVLVLGLAIVSFSVLMTGESSADSYACVIYEHRDYEGAYKRFGVGRYDINELGIGNDQLSSIQVQPGYLVVLYEHENFEGEYINVKNNMNYIGDWWNDKVSSIEVYSGRRR